MSLVQGVFVLDMRVNKARKKRRSSDGLEGGMRFSLNWLDGVDIGGRRCEDLALLERCYFWIGFGSHRSIYTAQIIHVFCPFTVFIYFLRLFNFSAPLVA